MASGAHARIRAHTLTGHLPRADLHISEIDEPASQPASHGEVLPPTHSRRNEVFFLDLQGRRRGVEGGRGGASQGKPRLGTLVISPLKFWCPFLSVLSILVPRFCVPHFPNDQSCPQNSFDAQVRFPCPVSLNISSFFLGARFVIPSFSVPRSSN